MRCIDDNGTCGLGGFCHQCPNLRGESMTNEATVKDLELWSKDESNPLIAEGYLMAAKKIESLENQLKRRNRFISGIKPYLLRDGYHGFVENITELENETK